MGTIEAAPQKVSVRVAYLMSCATPQRETVTNRDGEELGELEHIVIDAPSGRIAYAVVVRGGVFGLGERLYAIPWGALEVDLDHQRFVLDIEKERFDSAPAFDEEHWPTMTDAGWMTAIHAFYGVNPYEPRKDDSQRPAPRA